MEEGEKLFKIKAICGIEGFPREEEFTNQSTKIKRILTEAGLDVKEIWTHGMIVRKIPEKLKSMEQDGGNGYITKGWK